MMRYAALGPWRVCLEGLVLFVYSVQRFTWLLQVLQGHHATQVLSANPDWS